MNLSQLLPPLTNRACFIGMTGSGKTTLAEYMLRFRRYVAVLDPKGELKFDGFKIVKTIAELKRFQDGERLLYRPSAAAMRDAKAGRGGDVDKFFEFCYVRRNTTVYVDEVTSICHGQNMPDPMHDIVHRGRSRSVELYSATQRPMFVPNNLFSETEDFFVFTLQMPQDRKKVQQFTGLNEELLEINQLPKQWFYHSRFGIHSRKLKLKVG